MKDFLGRELQKGQIIVHTSGTKSTGFTVLQIYDFTPCMVKANVILSKRKYSKTISPDNVIILSDEGVKQMLVKEKLKEML